jgi:hypothetical protein
MSISKLSERRELLHSILVQSQNDKSLTRPSLKDANIINQVVDDFTPKCFLELYYADKEERVTLGNVLKKKHTKEKPYMMIFCPKVRHTTGLTIVLTDPDAPSRSNPRWGEMCHWIAITDGHSLDAGFNIGDCGDEIVSCMRLPSFKSFVFQSLEELANVYMDL